MRKEWTVRGKFVYNERGVSGKLNFVFRRKDGNMEKYLCLVCGYVYDPAENNDVSFSDLSEDWVCPECGAGKDQFEKIS